MAFAFVVYGVRFNDAIKFVKETKIVTKYDEDTGKPYEKSIVSNNLIIFDNIKIPYNYDEIKFRTLNDCINHLNTGLGVYYSNGYTFNASNVIFGFSIGMTNEFNPILLHLERFKEVAKEKFAKVGYDGELSLYLVVHK